MYWHYERRLKAKEQRKTRLHDRAGPYYARGRTWARDATCARVTGEALRWRFYAGGSTLARRVVTYSIKYPI
ncbi:hypothetical protein HIM_05195 [Hirsutella minnesotensis 3608]|uniref:Uncharacterized protein n=1 Tax=Hirsutella minnesotensis 3608 TaxID=1043627 RepID=A0A0F8A5K7_9HYPO|nr:hypothetical protein HIM_05195 [Hirsutella minnesotensis 3608]